VFWFWFAKCNTFVSGFFLPFLFFFLIQKYAALLRIQEKKEISFCSLLTIHVINSEFPLHWCCMSVGTYGFEESMLISFFYFNNTGIL